MAYPSRLLNDHEAVTVDLHPHWSYLALPVCSVILSIVAGIVALAATDAETTVRTVAVWAAIVMIGLSAFWLVRRYARWSTTYFVVTDQRVIYRSGLLVTHGIEIPLDRVQAVHFRQGVLGRLVGAGDLLVESGGDLGHQRFTDIRQPIRVQRAIHEQLSARQRRTGADDRDAHRDVADQLERLEQLRDRGTITAEEFERQKRRLLGD